MIKDDARKYPQRNELVGGFAGGELGLKTFAEKGDVPLAGAYVYGWVGECGGGEGWGVCERGDVGRLSFRDGLKLIGLQGRAPLPSQVSRLCIARWVGVWGQERWWVWVCREPVAWQLLRKMFVWEAIQQSGWGGRAAGMLFDMIGPVPELGMISGSSCLTSNITLSTDAAATSLSGCTAAQHYAS